MHTKPNANEHDREDSYMREFSTWAEQIAKRTPEQEARDNEFHEAASEYAKYNRDHEVE